MGKFIGGSAPAMAAQVAEGYILLSTATLKGMSPGDLGALRTELDKLLRQARAETAPADDAGAAQARNRRIARISSALQVVSQKLTSGR